MRRGKSLWGYKDAIRTNKKYVVTGIAATGIADSLLFRCGVLGVNSCARPRYTEPRLPG